MSSDYNGHVTSTSPSWSPSPIELPSAQPTRGPSRPVSARAGTARPSAGQRPVSAGTSLVLQPRQPEARRSSDQHLQAAGHAFQSSMGELFEGFCVKLRRDLSRDVAQAIGEMHAAVAGRRELEQVAADIKAEVKTESAVLRQKLIQCVHQLSGEMRSSRPTQHGQDAGAADPGLGALGEGLAELRAAVKALGPELAAVRSAVGELQAAASSSASWPAPQEPSAAHADLGMLLEEVRGLRAHVDSSLVAAAPTSRSPVPQGAAADAAAGANSLGGAHRHWPWEDGSCQPSAPSMTAGDVNASTLALRHTRDHCLAALLEEIRDFRSKHDADISEVVRASREVRAMVFRELKDMQTQHEVDLGNVVSAVKGTGRNCPVDFSPVLAEIRQLHPAMHAEVSMAVDHIKAEHSQLLRAVDDVKRQVDFTEVLQAVGAHKPEVDFSPVFRAIDDSRHAMEYLPSIKEIKQSVAEIKEGKLAMDFSSIVKELKQMQVCVDTGTSAILQTLRDGSQVVDFSAVLRAVEARSVEVKSEVLQALRQQQAGAVDFAPVLREVRDCRTALDSTKGLAEVRQSLREIRAGQLQADSAPVLAELRHLQSQLDACRSAVKAMSESKLSVDCSEIAAAVGAVRAEVDLSQVLQAIRRLEGQMALQERALQERKADVDLSPILQAIREHAVDLSPVLQAVGESATDLYPIHKALQAQFSELRQAIDDSRRALDSSAGFAEVKQLVRDVGERQRAASSAGPLPANGEVDLSPVLKAIDESRAALDCSQSLREIRQALGDIREGRLDVDHSPVLEEVRRKHSQVESMISCAVRTTSEAIQTVKSEVDFSEVLRAIQEQTPRADLSPTTSSTDSSRIAQDFSKSIQEIRAEVRQVRTHQLGSDQSPVASELRQMKAHFESQLSAILKTMSEGGILVDFSSLVQSIEAVEREVMTEVREVKSECGVACATILKIMKEGQLSVDAVPLMKVVESMKNEVLAAIGERGRDADASRAAEADDAGKLPADFARALQEIRADVRKVAEEKLGAGISSVLAEVRQTRSALDMSQSIEAMKRDLREVRDGNLGVDLPGVMRELQRTHSQVDAGLSAVLKTLNDGVQADLSAIIPAIEAFKIEVDLSDVLAAVNSLKGHLDISPILDAVRQHRPEVDLAPVLKAIGDSRSSSDVAQSIQELRQDLKEVKQAGPSGMDLLLAFKDVQRMHSQVDAGLKSVLAAIEGMKAEVSAASSDVAQGVEEIKQAERDFKDLRLGIDVSLLASEVQQMRTCLASTTRSAPVDLSPVVEEVKQVRSLLDSRMSAVVKAMKEGALAVDLSPLMKQLEDTRQEVIRAVRVGADLEPILSALGDANGGQADLARLVGEVLHMLGEMREGQLRAQSEPLPVPEDLRQQLLRVECSLSALHGWIIPGGVQQRGELQDGEKHQALTNYAQWQDCITDGNDHPWLAQCGYQDKDPHRRPASAPPRSTTTWRREAEQHLCRHDDPDEDPDLALAESMAVRGQHLAEAAAEAQCRAEAIEAAEAALELPIEASVQSVGSVGTEGGYWLPPIPEEPDPEATMPSPVDQAPRFAPPWLDDQPFGQQ